MSKRIGSGRATAVAVALLAFLFAMRGTAHAQSGETLLGAMGCVVRGSGAGFAIYDAAGNVIASGTTVAEYNAAVAALTSGGGAVAGEGGAAAGLGTTGCLCAGSVMLVTASGVILIAYLTSDPNAPPPSSDEPAQGMCQRPKKPKKPRLTGDPHMTTLDGLAVDFQGVGEYWLFRSAQLGTSFAARLVQAGDSVSIVDSAAMTVTDAAGQKHQISFFPASANGDSPIFLDGVAMPSTGNDVANNPSWRLPGGYIAVFDGSTISIFGDVVVFTVAQADASVSVDESIVTDYDGLLGSSKVSDDDPSNDLVDRSGNVIMETTWAADDVFTALSTWRVTEAESPFYYAPGETWATYQNFSFPPAPPPQLGDDELSMGADACAAVVDNVQYQRCTYDYAMTGNDAVVAAAVAAPPVVAVLVTDDAGMATIVPPDDVTAATDNMSMP